MRTAIGRQVVCALAAMVLGVGGAGAQGPGPAGPVVIQRQPPFERAFAGHGEMGRWWNNPRMIERLKLSDEQRKEMDQILYQHREKLIDLRANLEKAELAMQPLMSADQPDRKAMESQIGKIVNARANLERANANFLLDIRMKLTADQWKQLRDLRSERQMMGRGREGRMWRQRPDGQAPPPPAPGGAPGSAPENPPGPGGAPTQ